MLVSELNPIRNFDVNFGKYIEKMKQQDDEHRINGIPDYAFALDFKLREQIRKLPFFYNLSKKLAEHNEARMRQIKMAGAVLAGPNQFSEIYEMTRDCAKRLKIGPPNVFIEHDQSMNAYTYAADTASPTIVIHSGIIERLTPGELKCVIGHECGHVHNEHLVYQSICDWIDSMSSGLGGAFQILTYSNILLFYEWSRAAEVTCDRAAMICSDNFDDAINVNKKLAYGTFINKEAEIDTATIRNQFDELSVAASAATEIFNSHPSSIRRVLVGEEFKKCEVLYKWRPDMKKPGMTLVSKEQTDKECEKYTAVIKGEMKGGQL